MFTRCCAATSAVPFQTAYAQAFRWLPWVGDSEMTQIHAARLVHVLRCWHCRRWQIARLANRWTSSGAALAGALAFLCLLPTQIHGASFRADSLLLPILLGVLLLLTRARHHAAGGHRRGRCCAASASQ